MSNISRRESLKLLAAAPLISPFSWKTGEAEQIQRQVQAEKAARAANQAFEPRFFTAHEYRTVEVLADLTIPPDGRSGGAVEAGVPEFIDFMMIDRPYMQTPLRGGLAWLDAHSRRRFGKVFVDLSEAQQKSILDEIAWPEKADPEVSHGVTFFSNFRDLTATGFWTSAMGIEDLQYLGNTFVHEWTGCPPEALQRLGVKYEDA